MSPDLSPELPWHERFFSGAWERIQPRSFSAEDTRLCAEALRELLQLETAERVLDVPCGDGRIAEHFAQWGHTVTGIDRSPHFLELARTRATERKLSVDYLQADMWEGDFGHEKFGAALSMWSSIGYASEADDRRYFQHLYEALAPGGALVVDTQCLETVLADFGDREWYLAGDIVVGEERQYDPASARVLSMWTFAGPDCFEQTESSLRIYSYRELEQMLAEIGFVEFESYGSMELEEFGIHSPRLVLLARRPQA